MTTNYDKDSGHIDIEELLAKSGPRPLVPREAEAIKPGSTIDKAEVIANRCKQCYAPMPCAKHENIEPLAVVTSLDINPTSILAHAHAADLECVVVIGMRKDGTEFFAASMSDAAETMYHAQRAIYKMNKIVDGDFENEHLGPRPAA